MMLLKCAVVASLLGVLAAAPALTEKRSEETIFFGNHQNKVREKKSDSGMEAKNEETGPTALSEKEGSLVDAKSKTEVESNPIGFADTDMAKMFTDVNASPKNAEDSVENAEKPSVVETDKPVEDENDKPLTEDAGLVQDMESENGGKDDGQNTADSSDATEQDASGSEDGSNAKNEKPVSMEPISPPQPGPASDISDEEKALASLTGIAKTSDENMTDAWESGEEDGDNEEVVDGDEGDDEGLYDYGDLRKYYEQLFRDRGKSLDFDPYAYYYYYPYLSSYDYRRKRSAKLPSRVYKRDVSEEDKELRRNKRSRRDVNDYSDATFSEDSLRDLWQLLQAAYKARPVDEEGIYYDQQPTYDAYVPRDAYRYVPQDDWNQELPPAAQYDLYRYVVSNSPPKRSSGGFGYAIFDQRRAFSPVFEPEEEAEPHGYLMLEEPEVERRAYEPYYAYPKRQYLSMVPGNKRAGFYPYADETQDGRWGAFVRHEQPEEKREKAADEYIQLYNLARALGKHGKFESDENK